MSKIVYDFVFDRLRSIRQDLIIQSNPNINHSIAILQACVRFHQLASYQLRNEIDTKFNFTHLLDCLKDLLLLYQLESENEHVQKMEAYAIYLLVNLGSQHSMHWGLNLPKKTRQDPYLSLAMQMNYAYLQRNFVRFFRLYKKLPVLLQLSCHWNLSHVLSSFITVMNTGFSSKNCKYPVTHFQALSAINDFKIIEDFCTNLNVCIDAEKNIVFSKSSIRQGGTDLKHYACHLIESNLKSISLEELFFIN